MNSAILRRTAFVLFKLAVSGFLLAFVLQKVGFSNILVHLREMNIGFFFLSSVIYLLLLYLSAVRWRILLGGSQPTAKLYSFTLIGAFFNNLLPGAVGGDAVKTYYLYKETGQGGKSIASVFMDRYLGFAALLCIGLISEFAALPDLVKIRMHWITPILFFAFLSGSLAVFGLRIGRRFSTLSDFYDSFHERLRDRRALYKAFFISLAVQMLSIFMVYLIARGLGQRPSFTALFVFVPIIIIVMMIPLSISGLGIRESAFALLFGLTGIPAEAGTAISFLWFLSIAAASSVGLIEYIRFRKKSTPTT